MQSKRRADHEDAYVLHTYPYKETSLIVEAFSRKFGRVSLLARGARRPRSAMRGVLLSFQALSLSWSASAELGNLVVASVYVPNGNKDYAVKIEFVKRLIAWAGEFAGRGKELILCGDMNIART